MPLQEKVKPEATYEDDGTRRYTRRFLFWTASADLGPNQVRQLIGFQKGMPYVHKGDVDAGATIKTIDVDPMEDKKTHWDITVQYSTKKDDKDTEDNPLDESPKLSARGVLIRESVMVDVDGEPLTNAAGQPFPYDIQDDVPRVVLTIVKNEPFFPVSIIGEYLGACNEEEYLGMDPFHIRMIGIGAGEEKNKNEVPYVVATYEMELSPTPYDPLPFENTGNQVFWYDSDVVKHLRLPREYNVQTGDWGNEISGPVYLSATGEQFREGTTEPEEKIIEKKLRKKKPFSDLNIFPPDVPDA